MEGLKVFINLSTVDMGDVEAELEDNFIDYGYDEQDRLVIVDEDDEEQVREILNNLGADYYIISIYI